MLGIQNPIRFLPPETIVLKTIGDESRRNGTDKLTCRQIGQVMGATRARKSKGKKSHSN